MKNIGLFLVVSLFFLTTSIFAQRKGIGGVLKDTITLVPEKFPVTRGDLPDAHTLIDFMPKIGNQRSIGSCMSWSSVYGAMTIAKRIENGDFEETPFSAISAHSSYRLYYDSICRMYSSKKGLYRDSKNWYCYFANCVRGAYPIEYLDRMKILGCAKMGLNENPYECDTLTPYYISYPNKIYDFSSVDVNKIEDLKKALLQNSPLVITIDFYDKRCWADDQYFNNGVWDGKNEGSVDGGHAMLLVGYDDKKAGGAFHIVNSWGDRFGQNGTFWIKYGDVNKIDHAYRIVLDPLKNKDINNISYPSGRISGNELEAGEYEASFSSNNNFAFITGSGSSSQLLDVKNKKTIDLSGLTNLDYSNDKRYIVGLTENARKIVLLSHLEENQLASKDFSITKLGAKNKVEFNLPNDLVVKSVHVCTKGWNNEIKDFKQVAIVSKDNRAFIWFPNSGKFMEVLKSSLFAKKNKTKYMFFNPNMNSFIMINKNNDVLRYDLDYKHKTRYQKKFINFEINNYISSGYDKLIFVGEKEAMEVRLSQQINKSIKNYINQKLLLKRTLVSTTNANLVEPIKFGLNIKGSTYYATNNEVYKWNGMNNHEKLNIKTTTTIEKMIDYQKQNVLLVKTKTSIIVYDLRKKSVIKEYKKINSMLGVSDDGILIAKDLFNNLISIDLKWLFLNF